MITPLVRRTWDRRNPLANHAPPDLDAWVQTTRRRTRQLARHQPVLRALIRPCGLSLHLT